MRKFLSVMLAAVTAVSMLGVTAAAHGGHCGGRHRSAAVRTVYYCQKDCTYCDGDNNGLCDTCGSKGYYCTDGCEYTDEDNDGICDNCNTKSVCSVKPQRVRRGHCHR